jgi:glycoside/pentoside/hexuronide:cation symporter, GPH family
MRGRRLVEAGRRGIGAESFGAGLKVGIFRTTDDDSCELPGAILCPSSTMPPQTSHSGDHHSTHHVTQSKDRVSLREKAGYSAGGMSYTLLGNSIGSMANVVLNIGLGMNPFLVGLLLAIPRFIDALLDPLIGAWSDNTRSRWGRRKPFMVVGAIGAGIFFVVLWWFPTVWSEMGQFWFFLTLSVVFYAFMSLFAVPWGAMGLSMTADYHERTRLMATNAFMSALAAILLSWLYALIKLPVFPDSITGARWVAVGLSVVTVVLGFVAVALCREKQTAAQSSHASEPVLPQIKSVVTNRAFLVLGSVVFFMCVGIFSIGSLPVYLAIYYIYGGDEHSASVLAGWNGTVWQVSSLLFVPLISLVATRIGKRHTLVMALFFALIGNLIKWFCYSPQHPLLFLVPPVFVALGFSALWTLTASMLADVCDLHELQTGNRNEGALNAMYGWVMKVGSTVAFALSGVLLNLTGFNQALGGNQSAATILSMRLLDIGVPAIAVVAAIVLAWIYPISEDRAYRIRAELEKRRGQLETT